MESQILKWVLNTLGKEAGLISQPTLLPNLNSGALNVFLLLTPMGNLKLQARSQKEIPREDFRPSARLATQGLTRAMTELIHCLSEQKTHNPPQTTLKNHQSKQKRGPLGHGVCGLVVGKFGMGKKCQPIVLVVI